MLKVGGKNKMAMPINMKPVLHSMGVLKNRVLYPCSYCSVLAQSRNKATWTKFFKKGDAKPKEVRKLRPEDGPSTVSRLDSLKKKEGLITVRGYNPPCDVADKIATIAHSIGGKSIDHHSPITDRKIKFQLLTKLMSEFDHVIPNTELNNLHTLDDVTTFFSTPVKDRSSYEDMAKLDLPPNLHIQMEPIRFDAERDTFFDGKNAFTGRPTIVSSLKFRRKYKGNEGESRNQRNMTRFEEMVMISRKT